MEPAAKAQAPQQRMIVVPQAKSTIKSIVTRVKDVATGSNEDEREPILSPENSRHYGTCGW